MYGVEVSVFGRLLLLCSFTEIESSRLAYVLLVSKS